MLCASNLMQVSTNSGDSLWVPSDSHYSTVFIYHNAAQNSYRVVAFDTQSNKACFLCPLK